MTHLFVAITWIGLSFGFSFWSLWLRSTNSSSPPSSVPIMSVWRSYDPFVLRWFRVRFTWFPPPSTQVSFDVWLLPTITQDPSKRKSTVGCLWWVSCSLWTSSWETPASNTVVSLWIRYLPVFVWWIDCPMYHASVDSRCPICSSWRKALVPRLHDASSHYRRSHDGVQRRNLWKSHRRYYPPCELLRIDNQGNRDQASPLLRKQTQSSPSSDDCAVDAIR